MKRAMTAAFLITLSLLLALGAGFCAVWRTHTVITGEPPSTAVTIDTEVWRNSPWQYCLFSPLRAVIELLDAESAWLGERIEERSP